MNTQFYTLIFITIYLLIVKSFHLLRIMYDFLFFFSLEGIFANWEINTKFFDNLYNLFIFHLKVSSLFDKFTMAKSYC